MNLEKSINSLSKRFNKLYHVIDFSNKTGLSQWRGKQIIPLDKWIEIKNTSQALDYFPDGFDQDFTHILEDDEIGFKQEDVTRWESDYQELMEYTKNPNYGRFKCFRCLLSPDGDDPIFIGINKLVAKGLNNDKQANSPIEYPCRVVNRFQCPYERTGKEAKSNFSIDKLFRLHKMAFNVEIAVAKARKADSEIRIKNKEELVHALTDEKILGGILEQGAKANEASRHIRTYLRENQTYIRNYFMKIKDLVKLEELRFY